MEEPEGEPGAQPGTLAPQCENTATADDINRDTDSPLSPNSTNEVAVSETGLENKGTVSLAGELSSIAKVTLGEEKEKVGAMAGDVNPSVKEEEADAGEVATAEVESVQCVHLVETAALHEAVIAGTEEVSKEEGSQIDHAVKKEGDDDQMEISMKEEVGPAVKTGSVSEAGAVREVMIAGSDDTMPKEEVEIEQKVELMDETERKEDVTRTDEEVPHLDQEMVHSETNIEDTDELQPEDSSPAQHEETNMDALMHDDHGDDMATDEDLTQDGDGDKATDEDLTQDGDGDKATDEDLTQDGDGDKATDEDLTQDGDGDNGDKATDEDLAQDGDGDKATDEDLTQDGDGDKATDEDLTQDGDGDKATDEDLTQDGDGDKAMNELSMGVDGDGLDDDTDDDQAKHGEEVMGTNDGEEDEEEDDPPPLPAKKSSGGRKKRGRPPRIKKGEEELCFICFDGGELVVCDRRSDE